MSKHRKAPDGALPTYLAPELEAMRGHLGALAVALERHAEVNAWARQDIERLRDQKRDLLEALKETEQFFAARAEQISAHVGSGFKPLRRRVRAVIAKAESQ